jgi:hypothetical protein
MALPILDGNQSATTLSTILTGGQHIPAHTVVSLGSQAITDVRSAVSGSVVTISNFPATQTIAGTVTANVGNSITIGALPYTTTITGVGSNFGQGGALAGSTVTAVPVILSSQGAGGAIQGFNGTNAFLNVGIQNVGGTSLNGVQTGLPISGTVTVGNSVTIGSLPAISGTVTANINDPTNVLFANQIGDALFASDSLVNNLNSYLAPENNIPISGTVTANAGNFAYEQDEDTTGEGDKGVLIGWRDNGSGEFRTVTDTQPLPISGTVTANAIGTRNFVDINAVTVSGFLGIGGWDSTNSQYAPLPLNDSGTGLLVAYDFADGGSFPISGTVTANNPSGALTTRFGSVTTANTAQLTSAVTKTSRKYLLVQNIATSTVTIGIGFAPTTTQGIQLTAGAGLTFDAFTPTGAIYWLSSVTGSNFSILEG